MKKFIIVLLERLFSRDLILDVLYIGSLSNVSDYRFVDIGENFRYRKLCNWLVRNLVGDDLFNKSSYIYNKYNGFLCDRRIKLMSDWFMLNKIYLSNRCVYLGDSDFSNYRQYSNGIISKFHKFSHKRFIDHWSVNNHLIK